MLVLRRGAKAKKNHEEVKTMISCHKQINTMQKIVETKTSTHYQSLTLHTNVCKLFVGKGKECLMRDDFYYMQEG